MSGGRALGPAACFAALVLVAAPASGGAASGGAARRHPARPSGVTVSPKPGVQAAGPSAQPSLVTRVATPEAVKLGQPFTYDVAITHVPGERYDLTAPATLGPFEVLDQSRLREDESGKSTTRFKLRMQLFELGAQVIPNLTFDVTDAHGRRAFTVQGVAVKGEATLKKGDDKKAVLADIKGLEEVPVSTYRLLYIAGGVLLAAAAAYALLRFLRRPRASRAVAAPPALLNVRTLKALDALAAEGLPAKGRKQEYYFRLSEILRGYLGQRYHFEAMECTGAELLALAESLRAPELPLTDLRRFVLESDLVKFAKEDASPEQCDEAMAVVRKLVERTYVPPSPPASVATAPAPKRHLARPPRGGR